MQVNTKRDGSSAVISFGVNLQVNFTVYVCHGWLTCVIKSYVTVTIIMIVYCRTFYAFYTSLRSGLLSVIDVK